MGAEICAVQVVLTVRDVDGSDRPYPDEVYDRVSELIEDAVMRAYEHGGLKDVLRCPPMVF